MWEETFIDIIESGETVSVNRAIQPLVLANQETSAAETWSKVSRGTLSGRGRLLFTVYRPKRKILQVASMHRLTKVQFTGSTTGESKSHDLFVSGGTDERVTAAQISLVYGRNGAGKSTFARDLHSVLTEKSGKLSFADGSESDSLGTLAGEPLKPSLFNDSFIESIGYREDNDDGGRLQTIVLFGEQKDNRERVEELEINIQSCINDLEEMGKRLDGLGDESSGKIHEQRNTIKGLLKRADSWADYKQRATGAERSPGVTENVVSRFEALTQQAPFDESIDELVQERTRVLDSLSGSREGSKVSRIGHPGVLDWDFQSVEALLDEVPKMESDGKYAQHYARILADERLSSAVLVAKAEFVDGNSGSCPTCTQGVSEVLRLELNQAIRQVLEADQRKSLIERVSRLKVLDEFFPLPYGENQLRVVSEAAISEYELSKNELSSVLRSMQAAVDQKVENPENRVSIPTLRYQEALQAFDQSLERLNAEIDVFNKDVDEHKRNLKRFDEVNEKIIASDVDLLEAGKKLSSLKKEKSDLTAEMRTLESRVETQRTELQRLQAQDLDQEAAIGLMNDYLSVIFAEKNRLTLIPADNAYRILSRGEDVRLHDLSTGERNIIALVYFIANVFRDSADHRVYAEQRFLILDDPISSFDSDNRFGVFLLLRQVIERFVKNQDTQIVLLSHDLALIQDLASVLKTIDNACFVTRQIDNHSIRHLKLDSFNTYADLLRKIYDYACVADPEQASEAEVPTGNEMRLVLEAFAEFEVSANIAELPKKKVVKEAIARQSVALERYFSGPIYKLLLHGESHSADSVRAGRVVIPQVATRSERQNIARDLIVIIDIIAPAHIPAKLAMKVPGRDERDHYDLCGFGENCHNWKTKIEDRTLSPTTGISTSR